MSGKEEEKGDSKYGGKEADAGDEKIDYSDEGKGAVTVSARLKGRF